MTADTDLRRRIGSMSPEALERLIYVVGSARGGTTLTKNVIGLHDNVISFRGPTHFLNHPWRHRRRIEPRLWNIVFWLPDSVHRSEVRDSLDDGRRAAFLRHVNQALVRRDLRELYQVYPLVRALDPEEQRDPQDVMAWLDKGNDFWGVHLLPRHFPEARFVFVVRDPRGAVASLAKRTADARPDTDLEVEPRDVIANAIYWRNLVQKELRFAHRQPDRTIFFRYEDLVTRPLEIVPRLYDFLGLPAVPEAKLRRQLEKVAYGASLDSNEKGAGLSRRPLERWRTSLSDEAVQIVAEICGPTARRLGYDMTPLHRRGIGAVARHMNGRRARLGVMAKLVYLRLREAQLGATPRSFAPLRLLEAV